MSTVGFRIRRDFERPDRELVEAFRGLPVANIADCMNRTPCLHADIRAFNRAPLLGVALTVSGTGGDNLLFHKALDLAKPGDIMVIADWGELGRACCGEIMVQYAVSKGIAGFVIDGYIRDSDEIAELDFPVYAKGATPNGPYKNGPGNINFPVSLGGQVICPGDILVGDGDGVAVIKPEDAKAVAEEARAVLIKETKILEDLKAGRGMDHSWVDAALAKKDCVYVD